MDFENLAATLGYFLGFVAFSDGEFVGFVPPLISIWLILSLFLFFFFFFFLFVFIFPCACGIQSKIRCDNTYMTSFLRTSIRNNKMFVVFTTIPIIF